MSTDKKIRVLLAKSDMDAHDRAIRFVAEILRDAGMEVIFIRYRIPQEVAPIAIQEGVDVVALSFYSPGALHETSIVMQALKDQGMNDVMVIVGGIIPPEDATELRQKGVAVFGPGRPIGELVECITSGRRANRI